MTILGIESSCDDTSVALLEVKDRSFVVLSEKTASQIDLHKPYGGVVPEIAGRAHAEHILPLVEEVMNGRGKPDVIAVTAGPGLMTGLLVGVETAKALSYLWNVPLVAVNHIEGHIHSVELADSPLIEYPALCLVVSGGHTELIWMRDSCDYERIGATRDDATGECFDKVGKLLGFEYPGGPKISAAGSAGNPNAIAFPRPMMHDATCDFSFAGLKTAALYWLRDHKPSEVSREDFCASFEQAIVDVLVEKTLQAAKQRHPKTIILGGGVAGNKKLRAVLASAINQQIPNSLFKIPNSQHCTDNGAMIAVAGYYRAQKGEYTPWKDIEVDPNWRVGEK